MLKFIGIGDLANVNYGNTCAYIKQDNTLLLIDCGVTAFQRIIELNLLENVQDFYVAITHNHPDHVAGLASLIFYTHYWIKVKTNVIVANDEQRKDLETLLAIQGLNDKHYSFKQENMNLFNNEMTLSYKSIKHVKDLKSFAINIKYNDQNLYYLGDNNDAVYIEKLVNNLNPNDKIYTDCTTYDYENKPHMELDTLVQIVPEKLRKQVYCMHLCDEESANQIQACGFKLVTKEQSKKEILDKIRAH